MSSVPHGVFACVCWGGGGGGVWTTDTYTLGLDCKTVGQNQFCKARSKAWYLQSHSLLSPLLFNFPLITRARGLDLGKIRDSFFAVFQDTS